MTAPLTRQDGGRAVPFDPMELHRRCCERAVKLVGGCVCSFRTSCPVHGTQHHGTHD